MKIDSNGMISLEGSNETYTLPVVCAWLTLAYDRTREYQRGSAERLSGAMMVASRIMVGLEFNHPTFGGAPCNRTLYIDDARGDRVYLHIDRGEFRFSQMFKHFDGKDIDPNPIPQFMIGHPVELD